MDIFPKKIKLLIDIQFFIFILRLTIFLYSSVSSKGLGKILFHEYKVGARRNYEAADTALLEHFGETVDRPLGDIALGRSGDKGANINIGLYVQTDAQWKWFCSFITSARMQELMGND